MSVMGYYLLHNGLFVAIAVIMALVVRSQKKRQRHQ